MARDTMTDKVNARKIKEYLPTALTPPNLSLWDRSIERERNDYHASKFQKNNPSLEQEKFSKIVESYAEYKAAQEQFWRGNGNGGKKRNRNLL
jgi:hypothetical protein